MYIYSHMHVYIFAEIRFQHTDPQAYIYKSTSSHTFNIC